jgi:lysophospholipase L1-like esterase
MSKKLLITSLLINLGVAIIGFAAISNIGSPSYIYYLITNRGRGEGMLKANRKDLFSKLPKQENKIVFLGNSITAFCEWSELMQNRDILNRGIAGDGTSDILNRLDDIISTNPKKVFLLIGINDLSYHPLQYTVDNYKLIVDKLQKQLPHSQLYLESVLPVHNSLRRVNILNEDIVTLNKRIQTFALERNLKYIDIHHNMLDTEGALRENLSKDGVHLNAEGYKIMRDALMQYVNEN